MGNKFKQLQSQLEAERKAREKEHQRADTERQRINTFQHQLTQVSQNKLGTLIKVRVLNLFKTLYSKLYIQYSISKIKDFLYYLFNGAKQKRPIPTI
ncbi:MAG: hypothetical protein ABH818_01090, partial [Patescibacteria group bacterium]